MKRVTGLFVLLLLCIPLQTSALAPLTTSPIALEITLTPELPRPYEEVRITLSSTEFNLAAYPIRISLDGTVIEEGIGIREARIVTGAPGSIATIVASADVDGTMYEAKKTLRPADVALMLEPVTTRPVWYEGGSLVGPGGRVRIVAIPTFYENERTPLPPSALMFRWNLEEKYLEDVSGLGKDVLDATAPNLYRDATVSVTVSTKDGSRVARANVLVAPTTPLVRLYRQDPLRGTLTQQALRNTVALVGEEETFRAEPFYFPETPGLSWSVDGVVSEEGPLLTLRPTGRGEGTARITLEARGSGPLGSAAADFLLRFGQTNSGIFGF